MSLKELFTNIANSIREKTGETTLIKAQDFPIKILGITGAGVVDLCAGTIEGVVDLSSATSLRKYALSDCRYISKVILPSGVTSIPENFLYTSTYSDVKLELDIPEGVTSLGKESLRKPFSILKLPTSLTTNNGASIGKCEITDLYFKGEIEQWLSITSGGTYTSGDMYFMIGSSTTNFYLKNSNGEYYLLEDLIIPENVTEIKAHAFAGYKKLKSICFNSSLTKIGNRSFYYCEGLNNKVIEIPESVTTFDGEAFGYTTGISFIMKSSSVPKLSSRTTLGSPSRILVPIGCGELYKTSTNWSSYADLIFEYNTINTLNVDSEFVNSEDYLYSTDNGTTWNQFTSSVMNLEYIPSIKFKSLNSEVVMVITGNTAIGTIANAVSDTYIPANNEVINITKG